MHATGWITHAINERNALVDFVNLEPRSTYAIVRFIRQYGLFSQGDQAGRAGHPEKVKAFWRDSKAQHQPFATSNSSVLEARDQVTAILKLARSGRNRDRESAVEELAKENPRFVKMMQLRHLDDFAKQLISHYVSLGLASVRLGVVPSRGRMTAVAFAADVRSALYVAVLSETVSGTYLKECKRAACRKLFVVTRPDKQYHDSECQHLDLMRRRRERQKSRTVRRGSK
jgi:hypothetical protein